MKPIAMIMNGHNSFNFNSYYDNILTKCYKLFSTNKRLLKCFIQISFSYGY